MKKLKIALQKSGRLHDESLRLLKDCGISIDNGRDQLKATAKNFPMEIYYLRNGDIPKYLMDGVVDCAIIGENLIVEKGIDIIVKEKLGFSKCRVSIAVPRSFEYSDIQDLQNKRIATSYPETTRKFMESQGLEAELHIINGSVEIAPNIGLSDAICDIVSSGSTLFKNNLQEVAVIMESEAVLAVSPKLESSADKLLQQLAFRIQSVLKGRSYRYVLLNAPNNKIEAIVEILPGMKSPTILPLAEAGWSSVHSVVNRDVFWEVIEELKQHGAEGILVCPIEKMVL
ncbi:ATP phosphoribosyltransferase [Constantimarinum furrinae]|uniref:ATP phosphoribosyltransferase n=1 Tax=Constantimarinum furrinae TaxID=2562285 RepID=A0A7G8PWI0_9FLAO|nr:ATP phosphoribosyltransferase [Constantimarinum furrinae]QNJ98696.1 ATP phosphoribosyltransferase [Constantimarinum furrinae]